MASRIPVVGPQDFKDYPKNLQTFFLAIARHFRTLDTVLSTSNVSSALPAIVAANAATQSGSYVQADVQSIATLANEMKTDFATAMAVMGEIRDALNEVLAALRDTPIQTG